MDRRSRPLASVSGGRWFCWGLPYAHVKAGRYPRSIARVAARGPFLRLGDTVRHYGPSGRDAMTELAERHRIYPATGARRRKFAFRASARRGVG